MEDDWPSTRELRDVDREVQRAARAGSVEPREMAGPDGEVVEEPVDEIEKVGHEAWQNLTGRDGYLPVLLLIFASMIAIPLIGDSRLGALVDVVLASGGLLLTVYRSTSRARVRRVSTLALGLTVFLSIVAIVTVTEEATTNTPLRFTLACMYLVILLACFPMVLIRSFQHRKVTINTVCATLTAYLLIGLIFMTIYRIFGSVAPPFFLQTTSPTAGQYSYFSFITLTTVGYGDLTPGSDPARAFVMVEAVIGQVFLVTTMARVVSLLGEERRSYVPPSFNQVVRRGSAAGGRPGPGTGTGAGSGTTTTTESGTVTTTGDDPDAPDPRGA